VPEAIVIMMTAYAAIDSAVEAIRLGAREYVPKPLDFTALRTTLAELCAEIARTATPSGPATLHAPESPAPAASAPGSGAVRRLLLVKTGDRAPGTTTARARTLLRVVKPDGAATAPGATVPRENDRRSSAGRARPRKPRSGSRTGNRS
jgi:DNA-binding NarL/FixJ family response regulator